MLAMRRQGLSSMAGSVRRPGVLSQVRLHACLRQPSLQQLRLLDKHGACLSLPAASPLRGAQAGPSTFPGST